MVVVKESILQVLVSAATIRREPVGVPSNSLWVSVPSHVTAVAGIC